MNTPRHVPLLLLVKSHVDTYARRDGAVVKAHDDKRQAHPKGFKPGQHVMFPHPKKDGKKTLGKFVGVRDGKSVVHHDEHGEMEFDHEHVVPARGVPKRADPEATRRAGDLLRAEQAKNKDKPAGRPVAKLDDRV